MQKLKSFVQNSFGKLGGLGGLVVVATLIVGFGSLTMAQAEVKFEDSRLEIDTVSRIRNCPVSVFKNIPSYNTPAGQALAKKLVKRPAGLMYKYVYVYDQINNVGRNGTIVSGYALCKENPASLQPYRPVYLVGNENPKTWLIVRPFDEVEAELNPAPKPKYFGE